MGHRFAAVAERFGGLRVVAQHLPRRGDLDAPHEVEPRERHHLTGADVRHARFPGGLPREPPRRVDHGADDPGERGLLERALNFRTRLAAQRRESDLDSRPSGDPMLSRFDHDPIHEMPVQ